MARRLFIVIRKLEQPRLRPWATDEDEAKRRSGRIITSRYRDSRKSCDVDFADRGFSDGSSVDESRQFRPHLREDERVQAVPMKNLIK